MSLSASHFLNACNPHTRGKASSRSRRLLFFIGAPNSASASPVVIFCPFLLLLFFTETIRFKSRFSLASWLLSPHTNSYPPYLNVLSSTSSVHFLFSIFALHLRNDGLPLASSVVMSRGKGCEVLNAGVGGFII